MVTETSLIVQSELLKYPIGGREGDELYDIER